MTHVNVGDLVKMKDSMYDSVLIGIALAISTSAAFWLVIGTPASSIVYSSGLLGAKDFMRGATLAWPLALIVIISMILFYWMPILGINLSI